MSDRAALLMIFAAAIWVIAGSYGLAELGEPSSAWLWCTIMGACS
jgi:hypothetical protein